MQLKNVGSNYMFWVIMMQIDHNELLGIKEYLFY